MNVSCFERLFLNNKPNTAEVKAAPWRYKRGDGFPPLGDSRHDPRPLISLLSAVMEKHAERAAARCPSHNQPGATGTPEHGVEILITLKQEIFPPV